jgi:hypothetical protein
MMKKLLRSLSGIAALLVPVALFAQAASREPAADPESASELLPVHRDTHSLEDGVLDATRGFLREDPAAFRAGLDRMEAATRRLDREADAAYDSELITYERAFHVTLDRAREFVARGDLDNAFHQFVWVQRSCLTCHQLAREQGLLPADTQGESEAQE